MSRYRIELCHKISVLHSWAMNPDKDTISSLSEDNARKACIHLEKLWSILDRRKEQP